MKEPKRYFFIGDLLPGQTRYPHHHFVLYDDYAALAAENERLSKMFADLETPYLSKNLIDSAYAEKLKALAAENERLRKAGDAVANLLGCMCDDDYYRLDDYYKEAVDAWLAAKKGRDAK